MNKIVLMITLLGIASVMPAMSYSDSHEETETSAVAEITKEDKQNEALRKKQEKARVANVKKQIEQTKGYLKSGNNLDKAENSMRTLLKDSLNIPDRQIHLLLFEAIRKQYNQGNEKLFLKQKVDTASLYFACQRMFRCLNELDSVELRPDKDGKVKIKYRKDNASYIAPYHVNLYSGGIFLFNHQRYKDAYSMLDTYLSAPSWGLFDGNKVKCDSAVCAHASYLAFVSAYKLNDYASALKYADNAKKHQSRYETTIQYLAEIYNSQRNKKEYVGYLKEGTKLYPTSTYFYPRLVDLYCDEGNYKDALDITEYIIKSDTANINARVVRQTILLNIKQYEQCIEEGIALIDSDENLPDAHYNTALAYYNMAQEVENNKQLPQKERVKQSKTLYRKCLPYMEKYREMEPEKKEKWLSVLYNVYLNLNMGKEFSEIEKL